MANITQSVADTSGFIAQVWANEALAVLRNNIVLAKYCARDSDFEDRAWVGKTLNIPYPGTFTAAAKTPGSVASVQAPSGGASVAVTLSNHQTVDTIIEDLAQATSGVNLIEKYAGPMAIALVEKVEGDLFAQYANFTGTSVGTSGTDLVASVIRTAKKNLDTALAPINDRYLVVSPKDMASLVGDSNLASYFAFAQPGVMASGNLPNIYGFNVAMSQLTPVVVGTPNSTKNIAFHKNALLLATRPFQDIPAGSGAQVAQAFDAQSGLSLRVTMQYSPQYRGMYIAMDILYGVVALRPSQGLVALG